MSFDRLAPYLDASDGDLVRAIRLYEWNAAVSGALFEVLADVEVILRNAIHTSMTAWSIRKGFGPNWFDNAHGLLESAELRDIDKARSRIEQEGKESIPEHLISALNFGFWRYLLTGRYQTTLWPQAIREGFPLLSQGGEGRLFRSVGRLHSLRNRIAHHEPVHSRPLDLDLRDGYFVVSSICTTTAIWVRRRSRAGCMLANSPLKRA